MPITAEQMKVAMSMKQALLEVYDPEAILLFGSLGRGDGDEFSDVDLLIVIETDRDVKDLSEEMARYLDPLARDKHVIVRTPREFCRQKDIPGTLVYSALNEGRMLFDKTDWQNDCTPLDSYQTRKREIMQQDYARLAQDFLVQAELSLQRGSLFRCRDFARFAVARAIKGLLVKHDLHPPRETDLVELLFKAQTQEQGLRRHAAFLRELNHYCPGRSDEPEILKSRAIVEEAAALVKEVTGWFEICL